MRKAAAKWLSFELSVISVLRVAVVGFFVALALGFVRGADTSVLVPSATGPVLGSIVSSAIILCLSALVLFSRYRGAATLALAAAIFWSSYLTMVIQAGTDQIGIFWRDLALIGLLLFTRDSRPSGYQVDLTAPFVRAKKQETRKGKSESTTITTRLPGRRKAQAHPKRVKTEIYREDFDIVRLH